MELEDGVAGGVDETHRVTPGEGFAVDEEDFDWLGCLGGGRFCDIVEVGDCKVAAGEAYAVWVDDEGCWCCCDEVGADGDGLFEGF